MNKHNKQSIINTIQDRDKSVYQTLLRLKRLGYMKRVTKPKTLIMFPSKKVKPLPEVYHHNLQQSIVGVFREVDTQVKIIYLKDTYTHVSFLK